MKAYVLLVGCAALGACNKGPEVHEKNASVAEVAQKVREASGGAKMLEPGRWETKVSMLDIDIPGMPPQAAAQMKQSLAKMQEHSFASCLTAQDLQKPKEDFFAGANKDCRYDHFTMSGGKIDATLHCDRKPDGGMTMTMSGNYSRDSYEATTAMDIAGGPQGNMKMKSHMESHRVGQCRGDEDNAKNGAQG